MIRFEKRLRRGLVILVFVLGVVYAVALVRPGITMRSVELPDFSGVLPHFRALSEELAPQWQMILDVPDKLEKPLEQVIQAYETIVK